MSTPAIRALALALPLLVPLAGGADHHHPTVPADDLAVLAHRLDARSYFHSQTFWPRRPFDSCPAIGAQLDLLVAVGDPPALEVVRRDLDLDTVAREDADPVHSHLSGAVGQHFVPVLELHFEHSIREGFLDNTLQHDRIFLGLGQIRLLRWTDDVAAGSALAREPKGRPTTVARTGRTCLIAQRVFAVGDAGGHAAPDGQSAR